MASPQSLLQEIRGIGRDFAVDALPRGFAWDIVDYIPNRRGAKLEARGPWAYSSSVAMAGQVWGGKHAAFSGGAKLLVVGGGTLYDHPTGGGAPVSLGSLGFGSVLTNGVLLRDRVYFADGAGAVVPIRVNWSGSAWSGITPISSTAPKAKLVEVYKDRLICSGDPANPQRVTFSPLETDPTTGPPFGPMANWDVKSFVDTSRAVTGLAPMGAQILCFHTKSIEKIRGSIPPGANLDTDMFIEMFSDQMGCQDPASICNWQENVIFANPRGVHLTDGATIRSLTDQGSIGDFWRAIYSRKASGTNVTAGVFLDFLFVTVISNYTPPGTAGPVAYTLVCNLNERTWFRLQNMKATCYIESEFGSEQMWMGEQTTNKLTALDTMFTWGVDMPEGSVTPATDAIDGNALPVLPLLDLGWHRLGAEGVKRLRHVYVSHQTQTVNPVTYAAPLEVLYETDVRMSRDNLVHAGYLPNRLRYGRNRLNLGRRGYGVQVIIRQVQPTYMSRLYDIGIEEWPQDRGKL